MHYVIPSIERFTRCACEESNRFSILLRVSDVNLGDVYKLCYPFYLRDKLYRGSLVVLSNFVCFTVPSDVYIFIWYAILLRCRMTNKDRKITNQRRSQNILIPILGHLCIYIGDNIAFFIFQVLL